MANERGMSTSPHRLFDHADIRVRNLDLAQGFYDPFLRALGMRGQQFGKDARVYLRFVDREVHEAIAVVLNPDHVPTHNRLAFAAPCRDEVDRLAEAAVKAGARNVEGPMDCPEYTATYYAAFFDDPDGNRLEICYR